MTDLLDEGMGGCSSANVDALSFAKTNGRKQKFALANRRVAFIRKFEWRSEALVGFIARSVRATMGKPKLQHYRIDVERLRSLLRGRREAMGLTMAQLAERAGVAPATVHKLEAGKLSVHLDKFIQVVDALSLSFGDIFSFDGSTTAEPPDPLAAKLAKALRDGDQAAVLRLLAENASTPPAGDAKRRSKS